MATIPAKAPLVVLTLLAVVVIGFNLGSNSLHNQDEAMHAVVAREAANQGHWLPLTYMQRPYFNKPPARIWLTALTFKAIGIDEWSVRFWSAVFGVSTVLILYLVGRRLWGERTAFLSALILLTSHQYLYNHCVRSGETDSMLIFCWTAALLGLQLAVEERDRRILYLSAACLGLCGMVKHLGFIPIVLVIAIGYVLGSGGWRAFSWRSWTASFGVACSVALPWHLVTWWMEGHAFIQRYFLGEILEKRLEAQGGGPSHLPSGYLASLATMARGSFPWSCLLPFAVVDIFARTDFRRRWLMPILWLTVALATTMISGRKFSWYVLPAFPAVAILVAALLDRFLEESGSVWTRVAVVLGGLLALTSVTNTATHNPFETLARDAMLSVRFLGRLRDPGGALIPAIGWHLLLATAVAVIYRVSSRLGNPRKTRGLLRTLLAVSILGLALYTVVVPLKFSRTRSPLHLISEAADEHLTLGETLNVRLPRRKSRYPRFNYYFADKNLRVLRPAELTADEIPGELLLTDVATLEQIRETVPNLTLPDRPLAQAQGMLLLRLPD